MLTTTTLLDIRRNNVYSRRTYGYLRSPPLTKVVGNNATWCNGATFGATVPPLVQRCHLWCIGATFGPTVPPMVHFRHHLFPTPSLHRKCRNPHRKCRNQSPTTVAVTSPLPPLLVWSSLWLSNIAMTYSLAECRALADTHDYLKNLIRLTVTVESDCLSTSIFTALRHTA